MKKILTLITLLLNILKSDAQRLNLRTDGYYFFDNKCDTIYISKLTKEDHEMFIKAGIKGNNKTPPCNPPNTVSQDGSSNMRFFCFFSNSLGTSFSVDCSDTPTITKELLNFQGIGKKASKFELDNKAITSIIINSDNTFTAQFGSSKFSFRRITGRIYPDRIELRFIYPPNFPMYDAGKLKVCKFYKFGTLPPLRKKFILKYREIPNN